METNNNIETKQIKTLPTWLCVLLFIIGMITLTGILKLFMDVLFGPYLMVKWMHNHVIFDIVNEFWMLISVLVIAALLLRFGEDKKMSSLGMSTKGRFGDFLMGSLIAALIMGIGFLILTKIGQIQIAKVRFHQADFLFSILLFALVAVTEEISMRGYVLGRLLRSNMNKYMALGITSLIFALMHVLNANASFLPILNIFLAGVLLGSTYIFTKNLWFPIGLHFFWNLIEGPVLGYQVSGQESFLSIIRIKRGSNILLNGGDFGFEGSIICTILMLIFIALILWVMENKNKNKQIFSSASDTTL
jgi:membrane protease YdiL (CAAX protease family)